LRPSLVGQRTLQAAGAAQPANCQPPLAAASCLSSGRSSLPAMPVLRAARVRVLEIWLVFACGASRTKKKKRKTLKHNSCSRQLELGTRGPTAAHGTQFIQATWDCPRRSPYCCCSRARTGRTQPIHTWDSRSYCCSRHAVYSYLGLAVLLLLTAHIPFKFGTRGPAVCCSRHVAAYLYAYTHLGLTALLSTLCAIPSAISARTHSAACSSFPSGRRTRAAFAHSHLCTLFLE
jgi:hypothetical protein